MDINSRVHRLRGHGGRAGRPFEHTNWLACWDGAVEDLIEIDAEEKLDSFLDSNLNSSENPKPDVLQPDQNAKKMPLPGAASHSNNMMLILKSYFYRPLSGTNENTNKITL